jgi:signal transduction histidine kinase
MGKLQYKLVRILLLTSTFPLILVGMITIALLGNIAVEDAKQRIGHYLQMSGSIFDDVNEDLKYIVRDQNRRIYTLLENNQINLLKEELKFIVEKDQLDFFFVTDNQGKIIICTSNLESEGLDLSQDPLVQKSLQGGIFVSNEILDENKLQMLGLLEKARIPGVKNTEGLVIIAVLPVINRQEKTIGVMAAGYLLNNNNRIIVDKVKKNTGLISSVFLRDLRICSNIPSKGEEYAVGSRLDSLQVKSIIEQRRRYIGRTLILGHWYMSGYMPIYNANQNVIGILGMSISERLIFILRDNLIKIFAIAVLVSIVLAFLFGLINGGRVVKSIEKLKLGTEAISSGNFNHRISVNSKDEIEELANFFNKMTAQLKVFKEELAGYSKELEEKVSQKSEELNATHAQLVQCERMAAMGRMATILGHELRNIFAGIQTITYNLKGTVAKEHPKMQNIIKDLEFEINYANDLLKKVLRFSHAKQPIMTEVDLNYIVKDVITSVEMGGLAKNIRITKNLNPGLPKIKADSLQIEEAISNLVTNAVQAMPEGGELTIITKKEPQALRIEVQDTGSGITQEALDNLFTPFFTTKSRGLGLGLSITKDIIRAHKGKIEVSTQLNKGTTFTVILPLFSSA